MSGWMSARPHVSYACARIRRRHGEELELAVLHGSTTREY